MGNVQFFTSPTEGKVVLFTANGVAMDPDCCCGPGPACPCALCVDTETLPASISVSLSGWGQGICANDCGDSLDGMYVLDCFVASPCAWRNVFAVSCGTQLELNLLITHDGVNVFYKLNVDLGSLFTRVRYAEFEYFVDTWPAPVTCRIGGPHGMTRSYARENVNNICEPNNLAATLWVP